MEKTVQFSPENANQFLTLLKQLRPHLTPETFQAIYDEAKATTSYHLIGLEEEGRLVALMGYRILCDFVHGRHLYIDDLVTSEEVRSKGLGARLLTIAEDIALEKGCQNLRLCTGIDNERGKAFYERNSWSMRAVVYKKKLKQ